MTNLLDEQRSDRLLISKVTNCSEEARELTEIPRFTVDLMESKQNVFGKSTIGGGLIWLTVETINSKHLKRVLFQLILQACFSIDSIPGCKLMGEDADENITDSELERIFVKLIKERNNV